MSIQSYLHLLSLNLRIQLKRTKKAMRGKALQAFPDQNHQAHIEAHLAIIATPVAEANAAIVMTLQGHVQEHPWIYG